jgi:hypothetical protein
MRTMRVLIAAAAIAATALLSAPLGAEAAPATAGASQSTVQPAAADAVYFYYDINRVGVCGAFPGSGNIGVCVNKGRSMWNNHVPGSLGDILAYCGADYTGASRGVYQGAVLNNLANYRFDLGAGKACYGQTLDRNIHSIKRTQLPRP